MKIKVILVVLAVLLIGLAVVFTPQLKLLKSMNDVKTSHYGAGVLKEAAREKSDDIYSSTGIVKTSEFKDFDRKVTVYGLTLYIHKTVSDDFINKVTETYKSMFPKGDGVDTKLQEDILQNMYRYKAVLPIVTEEKQAMGDSAMKMMKTNSVCDIIMKTKNNQTNEVVEHLLHAITDIGLSMSLKADWGFEGSKLSAFMNEAVKNGYYNTKSYSSYKGEMKNRVIVQEYAYWLISSAWDLQDTYGVGDTEWQLTNPKLLKEKAPTSLTFVEESLSKVIIAPRADLLKGF